ncbi:MAG: sulfate adenylyltransferase subunit CysN [Pseudomonadota bacterium]
MSAVELEKHADIEAYLAAQADKSFLRFITCGSVDDGKSTLIGRLLYDSKLIFDDQLSALESDSKRMGTQGEKIDFALLVDGLAAEREQGITIDVAYRFFTTDKRKFIVADTPGHEQYTRNMATGASTADLAIILVDARQGLMTQTRRHSFIASLFGIRNIVLAVNKMDLVGYDESLFNEIASDYLTFAEGLNFSSITCIPMSALEGDNIMEHSANTPWYNGRTLMHHLETVSVDDDAESASFRLPVQWVNRPNLDFRGYSGTVASGTIEPGTAVTAMPSGKSSVVEKIVTYDGELDKAVAGQAVTLTLRDEIDISRGDVLCLESDPIQVSNQVQTHIVWMSENNLVPGREYLLKSGTRTTPCVVTQLKHKINVNTLESQSGKTLSLNEIGVANLKLGDKIAFDNYENNRATGNFIIVDRQSNETVGAGLIDFSLHRADNVVWHTLSVDKYRRSAIKQQKSCVLWMTGLSGSGKSTIANLLESRLHDANHHTYILDGDNVRHGLNKDLGFVEADRVENIRRVGETAKLMADAGLIVIASFIAPFAKDREMVRKLMEPGEFIEVFVSTPLDECEKRDPKGLYVKARAGEIKNFTGIGSDYEEPTDAEIVLPTHELKPEESVEQLVAYLEEKGFLTSPDV